MFNFFDIKYLWQSGQTHIDAFVKILSNVSKEDTTEYILVLVDEILSGR